MNHPTEWPPEVPHGENPPAGGLIDYYLAADATGPVTLDILDAKGTVVRSLSSDDPVLKPDPALDPEGYDRICRATPTAPNCRVPLYWPAPQMVLKTKKGMHRFSWDLHFEPLGDEPRAAGGVGAVPGRTYPVVPSPWAPPGQYTARLTVAGQSYTQPLTLRLDPRVKTPSADLERAATLSREMYDGAVAANAAYLAARALVEKLEASGAAAAALKAEVEALAPRPRPATSGPFPGAAAPAGPPTLDGVSQSLMRAAMGMQEAEAAPTARQVAACDAARAQLQEVMPRWNALRSRGER